MKQSNAKKEERDIIVYTDTSANIPSIPTIRRSKCLHTNMKTVNTKFSIIVFWITVAAACSLDTVLCCFVFGFLVRFFLSLSIKLSVQLCAMCYEFILFIPFFLSVPLHFTCSLFHTKYDERSERSIRFVLHRVERVLCCIYMTFCCYSCWFCSYIVIIVGC